MVSGVNRSDEGSRVMATIKGDAVKVPAGSARMWRVVLARTETVVVLAPTREEAERLARFDWARTHRRSFGSAPKVVECRRV